MDKLVECSCKELARRWNIDLLEPLMKQKKRTVRTQTWLVDYSRSKDREMQSVLPTGRLLTREGLVTRRVSEEEN